MATDGDSIDRIDLIKTEFSENNIHGYGPKNAWIPYVPVTYAGGLEKESFKGFGLFFRTIQGLFFGIEELIRGKWYGNTWYNNAGAVGSQAYPHGYEKYWDFYSLDGLMWAFVDSIIGMFITMIGLPYLLYIFVYFGDYLDAGNGVVVIWAMVPVLLWLVALTGVGAIVALPIWVVWAVFMYATGIDFAFFRMLGYDLDPAEEYYFYPEMIQLDMDEWNAAIQNQPWAYNIGIYGELQQMDEMEMNEM